MIYSTLSIYGYFSSECPILCQAPTQTISSILVLVLVTILEGSRVYRNRKLTPH